jgi:multidrug efflux pump subunit AcrA (membrane-fusion protein)
VTPARRTVAIVLGAIVLVGLLAWALLHRTPPPTPVAVAPQTPLATVVEGSVEQSIHLAGRVGPAAGTQTKLAFPVAGTVSQVNVRLGDRVGAGTPLAQIDATSFSLAAQQAGADAQAAAAAASAASVDRLSVKLRVDEAELYRQQRLYAAGIVALRDVQAAQASVAADRAERQGSRDQTVAAQAQARSASARAAATSYDLARTTLRAPTAGTVTAIFVQPGEAVDPTTAAIAITPALGDVATLDVPVTDIVRISTGDPVRVRAGGRSFTAVVAGVAPSVNPATGLATLDIRGIPSDVPAGTPLDALVTVGRVRGLVVPRGAIVEDPENGNTLVFVQTHARDGSMRFESRTVTVDAQSDSLVRVSSGLRAGERVAAQGAIDLLAPAGG